MEFTWALIFNGNLFLKKTCPSDASLQPATAAALTNTVQNVNFLQSVPSEMLSCGRYCISWV